MSSRPKHPLDPQSIEMGATDEPSSEASSTTAYINYEKDRRRRECRHHVHDRLDCDLKKGPLYDRIRGRARIAQFGWRVELLERHERKEIRGLEEGIPRYAQVIAADPNLQIYSRFSWLYSCCLLEMQEELLELEDRLRHFYSDDDRIPSPLGHQASPRARPAPTTHLPNGAPTEPTYPRAAHIRNGEHSGREISRAGTSRQREKELLMQAIQKKLLEYGDLLQQFSTILNYRSPPVGAFHAFQFWVTDKLAIRAGHRHRRFRRRQDDLLTLYIDETATILGWCLRTVVMLLRLGFRYFTKTLRDKVVEPLLPSREHQHGDPESPGMVRHHEKSARYENATYKYYKHRAFSRTVRALVNFVGLALILLPGGLLYMKFDTWSQWDKLAWTIVFSVVFYLFLTLTSIVTPREFFPIVQSYCAFLVVFLALSGPSTNGGSASSGS